MKNILIGIAGGTASGKTTIAFSLEKIFSEEVTIIKLDNYYKCQDHLSPEQRVSVNYDHPNAFDFDLLLEQLIALQNGLSINQPLYDFTQHTRSKETKYVQPTKVIIIEGILVFADQRLINLMNIKVFIDTEADLRVIRRLLRDTKERGRSLDQSITQYIETAKPGHDTFVEPTKKIADVIIPYTNHNTVAIDMLAVKVQDLLKKN